MKQSIKEAIREHKLIAIIRGVEAEACIHVAQALYDGGIRLMEITYDQKHPESWETTARTIGQVAGAFSGKMYVGAGTVTSPELAELTHRYGGQFIISPDTNEAVIRRACQLGMATSSGAPKRPIGISTAMASSSSSEKQWFISVSMIPQAMAFTVMPLGASSFASALVKASMPPLEAE